MRTVTVYQRSWHVYKGYKRTVGYIRLAESCDPTRTRAADLYLFKVSRELVRDVVSIVDSAAGDQVFDEAENLRNSQSRESGSAHHYLPRRGVCRPEFSP